MRLKIKYKLFFSYFMAFFLTMSLGSIIIYSISRKTIEIRIERELTNSTTTILNMVHTTVTVSIKNHLRTIAEKNREVLSYLYQQSVNNLLDETEAKHRAEQILLSQTIGTTGYIYCISHKGIVLVHPKPALIGTDLSKHEFIRIQKERRRGYLEYHWKNPGEKKARPKAIYMTYFEPWDWIISASSYRKEFHNLVNMKDFRESIHSLRFGRTGYAQVYDLNGNKMITSMQTPYHLESTGANYETFIQNMIASRNGKLIYTASKKDKLSPVKYLVIFNEIPEFQWIVACLSDLEEVYAPLKNIRNVMLMLIALSLILFLPVTLWVSASITRPLHMLMKHLSRDDRDDLSIRMHIKSRDEIGLLAKYFNSYMERLEIKDRKLKNEINERIKMEEMIIQSEKMMSIGGLAAGMAHEINNPLGAMVQNTQNIVRRLSPTLPANQKAALSCNTDMETISQYITSRQIDDFLEGIRSSGAQASAIITRMLNFSRRSDEQMDRVDITQLIEKTIALAAHDYDLKKKYDFRNIDIKRIFENNLPMILCDPTEIQQVILNLLKNAAQAMMKYSEKPTIHLSISKQDDHIIISIEDNGPGIKKSIRNRVFEPFFTTKSVGVGTGLGLSISYFIITSHHKGSISVDASKSGGGKFVIRLPISNSISL